MLKMIKRGLLWMLRKVFSLCPTRKIIIFESNPDYSCNTFPVFLELRTMLPDYRLVWYTSKESRRKKQKAFFYDDDSFFNRIKSEYYMHLSSAFVSCNRIINKQREEQLSVFLCHGSKTKKTRGSYEVGDKVDYINVQSHFFDDIVAYEYNCDKSRLVYLGYPRCDFFYKETQIKVDLKKRLFSNESCKYLVWLPTFRKHATSRFENQMDCQKYESMGIPLIYSLHELEKLDAWLKSQDMYIVYKPHPAQDVSLIKKVSLKNFLIIDDQFLADMSLQLNELLAASDGMITDYSSVFFDYLLLDKPIASTIDDIDEWKKMTGFAYDFDEFLNKATMRLSDTTELIQFLSNLDQIKEKYAAGRKEIRELTNIHFDGNSAKRVSEFIKDKLRE